MKVRPIFQLFLSAQNQVLLTRSGDNLLPKTGFFLKEEFKNTMLSVSCALTRAEAQRNRNTKLRTEPKEQL